MTVYLSQNDFAKSMADLLYAGGGAASIAGNDPFWIDSINNAAAVGVDHLDPSNPNNGLNAAGVLAGYRLLTAGSPSVDIAPFTGLASPNTSYYRGKTAGTPGRATGVQVDSAGRVGIFLNGFDTPSVVDFGVPRSYGPDIHLLREYVSPTVYAGVASSQCLRVACILNLGVSYFSPAAGLQAGVGGQIGWRVSFKRYDNAPLRSGVSEIVVLVGMWESRNLGDPGFDGNDSTPYVTAGEHWIAGTVAAGKTSAFVESHGDAMLTGPAGNRSAILRWDITRKNMLNILSAFGISGTAPEDLRITGTTFSGELYDNRPDSLRTQFKPGQFGFSVSDQIVVIS
ncbi:hypothetical protein [Delftia acidovorans]|uniref:hypothetical protein n=1 Tax=Delftia acidovorans TaxID=80866 RepID=UPI0028ACC85B|nr:hypothetical protein [Delftia acidovorans]